ASQHKSEFLASMSHELRTPLNAVIGFSDVLLERMFGDLNEKQEDYLRDIRDAGRHLLALLNDVLDLSKVEAGQMELAITTFDAATAFHYALSLVRERAAEHGIDLRLDVAPALQVIRADELRLRQVLLNLLSNAVKFTPDGGSVAVSAWLDGTDLLVTVSDTGVGIPQTDQERIFDSFQQGGRFVVSSEGTGLGLTVTKRIVQLHGGRIWVTSAPGLGSSFGFSIPGQTVGAVREIPTVPEADLGDPRPAVLVVEDDERSGELVALHLTAAGLRPVVIRDGREGIAAVRSLRPVAVVLDIKLPGMSGWEILHALKSDPDIAGTPVVIVSVLPERGKGFALGAADYLVKPVDREDLVHSVRRVVADATSRAAGRTIVVVDDDPMALELVRVTLEPQGWSVRVCERGADAVELVSSTQPSVVLVDLLMPETDGFAVIDALAGRPDTADIPVVVLTAKSLNATDRERLDGRIKFVASKSALDLDVLAQRLVRVSRPAASGAS
ncbi:MAG TPA: response regulator, partial [Lapillicoccus sp.]|nr:response regulator [Lapillicoccus sp.]